MGPSTPLPQSMSRHSENNTQVTAEKWTHSPEVPDLKTGNSRERDTRRRWSRRQHTLFKQRQQAMHHQQIRSIWQAQCVCVCARARAVTSDVPNSRPSTRIAMRIAFSEIHRGVVGKARSNSPLSLRRPGFDPVGCARCFSIAIMQFACFQ